MTLLQSVTVDPGRSITSFGATHSARGYISEDVLVIDAPAAAAAISASLSRYLH